MLRQRAEAKDLELRLDISASVPQFIRSDGRKLRQVLVNLVGNAIKYTDQGRVEVKVDTNHHEDSRSLRLLIEVEDTGIGIAPEDEARIFDPFVEAAGIGFRKGTGLGLSISRHFVECLGGSIKLGSTLGRGSTFYVEVPVQIAEAAGVMSENAGNKSIIGLKPGQPDYRILIVEDEKDNWLLLHKLLRTVGFQVRVVEDGLEAVGMFETWQPHFIWTDVRLPVLDGLEATQRIRRMSGGDQVKIVAVSAPALASERDAVLDAGLDDFLRKPYRPAEIFTCMARHLAVEYVYGIRPETAVRDVLFVLRTEDVATLPAALREELEKAVISLDRDQMLLVIGQISEQNAYLGSALGDLTNKLAYTPILRALQSCSGKLMETGAR